MLNKILITAACLISSLAFAEDNAPLDLAPSEVVPSHRDYRVIDSSEPYLLSGIPKRDTATGIVSFLAVSPINLATQAEAAPTKGYFGGLKNRPLTWDNAVTSCNNYKAAGKAWRLPTRNELQQLNFYLDFRGKVLDSTSEELAKINANWSALQYRMLPQFNFFWTSSEDSKFPPEMKLAGFFGSDGKIQSMSKARPLSFVCITYFSGPARETDLVLPTLKELEKDQG